MGIRVTPEQAKAKWVNRLSAATSEIQAGIDRVTQSPGAAAVAKRDKWRQNVAQAEEKWARNTARVSLDDWKQAAKDVGVPRIAQGAQAKQGKYEAFAQSFFPHLERGIAAVERMPDTSFEERVQRSVAMMRHNREFKRGGA